MEDKTGANAAPDLRRRARQRQSREHAVDRDWNTDKYGRILRPQRDHTNIATDFGKNLKATQTSYLYDE